MTATPVEATGDRGRETTVREQRTRSSGRRIVAVLMGAVALGGILLLVPLSAYGTSGDPHKVTICHRTSSYTNPYVVITVDVASVQFQGHDGHDGPVFSPDIPKHEKWGDIIPAFDFGPDHQYAGKNWDADGQDIWNSGCQAGGTTTTTEATTTTRIG